MGMAAASSPRTRARPPASSMSAGLASSRLPATRRSWPATMSAAPLAPARAAPPAPPQWAAHDVGGPAGRAAAGHHGPAAPGAPAVGGQVGVALLQLHLVRVDAEAVGDDLRERRLVPLAVPTGPAGDDDLAGRIHPDQRGVIARGHPHP